MCIGLITTLYQSGDQHEESNYRRLTVGYVIAKMFAMDFWNKNSLMGAHEPAEEQVVRAKGEAGFQKDVCTTNINFSLRSLTDRTRQTWRTGKLLCSCASSKRALDTAPHGMLWQAAGGSWCLCHKPGCHQACLCT